jgi:hypothetical protein
MFALIHNNKIKLGPIPWNYDVFKNFLVRKKLDHFHLPAVFISTAIITEEWQIKRALLDPPPAYNKIFEELAGPFWTIGQVDVYGSYSIVECSLSVAKLNLKRAVASLRYEAEIAGISVILESGISFLIDTTRENRSIFFELSRTNQSVFYKNKDGSFTELTISDINHIVNNISNYIQYLYRKEREILIQIDSADTIESLKTIKLDESVFKE